MDNKPEIINENITLFQKDKSLSFGTDAYLLSAYIKSNSKKACEFGAGTGVISLLCLAKEKIKSSLLVEIQESLSEISKSNAIENGFNDKVEVLCKDLREIPKEYNESFDTVLTNPPYMKMTSGKLNDDSSNLMCRHEVNGDISDFAKNASRLLKFGGMFYVVYRPDRLSELLFACEKNNLHVKRMTLVYPTTEHVPCIVLISAKKGASDGMITTKPLIMYKDKSNMSDSGFTDDLKYIYEHGDFPKEYR